MATSFLQRMSGYPKIQVCEKYDSGKKAGRPKNQRLIADGKLHGTAYNVKSLLYTIRKQQRNRGETTKKRRTVNSL